MYLFWCWLNHIFGWSEIPCLCISLLIHDTITRDVDGLGEPIYPVTQPTIYGGKNHMGQPTISPRLTWVGGLVTHGPRVGLTHILHHVYALTGSSRCWWAVATTTCIRVNTTAKSVAYFSCSLPHHLYLHLCSPLVLDVGLGIQFNMCLLELWSPCL